VDAYRVLGGKLYRQKKTVISLGLITVLLLAAVLDLGHYQPLPS
jgi:hypothetical protein